MSLFPIRMRGELLWVGSMPVAKFLSLCFFGHHIQRKVSPSLALCNHFPRSWLSKLQARCGLSVCFLWLLGEGLIPRTPLAMDLALSITTSITIPLLVKKRSHLFTNNDAFPSILLTMCKKDYQLLGTWITIH